MDWLFPSLLWLSPIQLTWPMATRYGSRMGCQWIRKSVNSSFTIFLSGAVCIYIYYYIYIYYNYILYYYIYILYYYIYINIYHYISRNRPHSDLGPKKALLFSNHFFVPTCDRLAGQNPFHFKTCDLDLKIAVETLKTQTLAWWKPASFAKQHMVFLAFHIVHIVHIVYCPYHSPKKTSNSQHLNVQFLSQHPWLSIPVNSHITMERSTIL